MSEIKARKVQSGISLSPANNLVFDASADNGSFVISRESGSSIFNIDSADDVTVQSDLTVVGNIAQSNAKTITDYEDIAQTGWYQTSGNSVLNGPESFAYQQSIFALVNNLGITFYVSRVTGNASNNIQFIGSRPFGSPIVWSTCYNQDNIWGGVSQIAGRPTGRIIESTTSASGSYTKWADGTMICNTPAGSSITTTTAFNSIFFNAGASVCNFPAQFSAVPAVTAKISASAGVAWIGSISVSTLAANVIILGGSSGSAGVPTVTAYGRWFNQ